tara:strand:+ start:91 stop:426 length:336 start_codon:yes stop_codon:yes gene_type:complete
MNIEPLKSYLQNKENISDELKSFLDNEIKYKLHLTEYVEKDFYINDKLFFIKKNTLELEYIGKVYCINGYEIGIKLSQYRNVTLNPKIYYIFRKIKMKTKRELMEELLEKL